jgi:hypothetical protein
MTDKYDELVKEAKELYAEHLHGKMSKDFKINTKSFDLETTGADNLLDALDHAYTNKEVKKFDKRSGEAFDKGLEKVVSDTFKEDEEKLKGGNFSEFSETEQELKTADFLIEIMKFASNHYDAISGYSTFSEDVFNPEHPKFQNMIDNVFGHLAGQQGGSISWEALKKKMSKILSDKDTNIKTMFGLKKGKDDVAGALYQQLFQGAESYATGHTDFYKGRLTEYINTIPLEKKEEIDKVKKRANEVLQRYAPGFNYHGDDVSGLELDLENADLTHTDATKLMLGLYTKPINEAVSPVIDYIKGEGDKVNDYLSRRPTEES